jgi:hypothetical protein
VAASSTERAVAYALGAYRLAKHGILGTLSLLVFAAAPFIVWRIVDTLLFPPPVATVLETDRWNARVELTIDGKPERCLVHNDRYTRRRVGDLISVRVERERVGTHCYEAPSPTAVVGGLSGTLCCLAPIGLLSASVSLRRLRTTFRRPSASSVSGARRATEVAAASAPGPTADRG